MKTKILFGGGLCIVLIAGWLATGNAAADSLFKGRRIHLAKPENRSFRLGITGTTAGFNFFALVENAKQESINLGELGYWEMVPDPPSFLRNYDLQVIIKNHSTSKFQIELEYDKKLRDLHYRIKTGPILVKLDTRGYYPALVIDDVASVSQMADTGRIKADFKRVLLFDFNSFDVDLREYYGKVKHLLNNSAFSHYFYYYEAANYNSYYFKIFPEVDNLDIEKMGLSTENATLGYYQKVLENLKSRLGSDFADQVIIITRFGKKFSPELKKYAQEIGISRNMAITFWSYEEIAPK